MDSEIAIAPHDPLPLSHELDENGFPIGSSSTDDDDDGDYEGYGDGDGEGRDVEDAAIADESSDAVSTFAADFYGSGTDWSSLVAAEEEGRKEKKGGLVQRSLLQMWGIKKPKEYEEGSGGMARNLGRKRRRSAMGGEEHVDRVDRRKGQEMKLDRPRVCPFYKKIPGTPFTVDAFRYGQIEGCLGYFLSHFHHDHYGGLSKRWSHGPIYCSSLTARLLKMCLSVNSLYICPLELDTEYDIEGVKVTMLDANHCPGAAVIHFRLSDGRTYLHTGDFRACKLMHSHPLLLNHRINVLYLDTTYLNPKYRFPPKEDVVDFVVKKTHNCLKKQPRTLVVVGAYSIGKENVYLAISQSLEVPIYANASRRRILQSFGWPELSGRLCSSGQSSPLHVLPLSFLRHENLKEYLKTLNKRFTAILAFRPTGWTFSESTGNQLDLIKPSTKGNVTIYGVPYSEHSSFTELRDFVKFLRPEKIIPTVNIGNAASRDKMQAYIREWLKV
ncbi:DNA cross-link repair protein SNM1 [Ananas comosus]|uniref:DNA cross-link repair protein SNM1 n=1 Tax=Ananas comosus TaxID=4615 RepID=A0A6P5GTU6_ANACO|nr:DNA cross-link repair protein SNM1 [Ananas comosus]